MTDYENDDSLYMPEEAASQHDPNREKSFASRSPKLMRLRPGVKQDESVDNHMLVLSYRPHNMLMFKGVVEPRTHTWFMPVHTHYVKGRDERGNTRTYTVGCKGALNDYYMKGYKNPLIYQAIVCPNPACNATCWFLHCVKCGTPLPVRERDSQCPSCEQAKRMWALWSAEWAKILPTIGIRTDNVRKAVGDLKRNNPAQHKALTLPGTLVNQLSTEAGSWSARDRYLFITFDIDKAMKWRQLAEGETEASILQILFQGKNVYELLAAFQRSGTAFWDAAAGIMVTLNRNTKRGMDRAEYMVITGPSALPMTPEWVQFLKAPTTVPDPSDEVTIWSYEEHANQAGLSLTREVAVQPGPPAVPGAAPPVAPAPAGYAAQPPVQPGYAPGPAPSPYPAAVPYQPPAAPASPPAPPYQPPTAPVAAPAAPPYQPQVAAPVAPAAPAYQPQPAAAPVAPAWTPPAPVAPVAPPVHVGPPPTYQGAVAPLTTMPPAPMSPPGATLAPPGAALPGPTAAPPPASPVPQAALPAPASAPPVPAAPVAPPVAPVAPVAPPAVPVETGRRRDW